LNDGSYTINNVESNTLTVNEPVITETINNFGGRVYIHPTRKFGQGNQDNEDEE